MGENATKSMSKFDYASWSGVVELIIKSIIIIPTMIWLTFAFFAPSDVINHSYNYRRISEIAVRNCNLKIMKFLVKNAVDIHDALGRGGMLLRSAAIEGCLEVVQFLVEEKVDINSSRALHYAAKQGNLEVVKFLLQKGADPNKKELWERTPRDFAVMMSRQNKDSNKPYREVINLLYDAEKRYKSDE